MACVMTYYDWIVTPNGRSTLEDLQRDDTGMPLWMKAQVHKDIYDGSKWSMECGRIAGGLRVELGETYEAPECGEESALKVAIKDINNIRNLKLLVKIVDASTEYWTDYNTKYGEQWLDYDARELEGTGHIYDGPNHL